MLLFGGVFAGIAYAASKDPVSALAMANRFGAIFLAVVPGMATSPVRMTRALSQVHTPRSVTLGMLIAMSFVPMLKGEIGRVREAMKTRGAGSILNPKILYRAFLVPLVMRLVNISDTLALSVETRGFALGKAPYSVYKKESVVISDILFLIGIAVGAALTVILGQDYEGLCAMVKILNRLHEETGNTVITVTHDVRCAEALCDRAIYIENGVVAKTGGKELVREYFSVEKFS